MRPVRYGDLDQVRRIFNTAFREEYGRRGVDIGAQVGRWKRLYPLIRVLSAFPNPYRYLLNMAVLEEDGQIQGFIQTTPGNAEQTRWHIDFVAVAPAFQGRGIGVQLVEGTFETYCARGVKCFTLEVDTANAPALRLYEKLGFRQYAAVTYYQMPAAPTPRGPAPAGLRPFRASDAAALYDLYEATTPQSVRLVDTRRPEDFALGWMERAMAGFRRSLKQVADERFVVEIEGRVVAYLRVMAQMRNLPHTVQLLVNPGYEHLTDGLLDAASEVLSRYQADGQPHMVLAWAPDYQPAKQKSLENWGMKAITVDRCLVRDNVIMLKLPTAESLGLADDKAFKPAFMVTSVTQMAGAATGQQPN